MNENEKKVVYVVSVEVRHGDIYDQQDDGTTVLGVYDDLELAEYRLVEEYDRDKFDLQEGSCRPDGVFEITEDNPLETHGTGNGKDYNAFAQITVSEKRDGSFEREYTYTITAHYLNW